jgi:predicted TIM-barrel fold metal-dependent hydrolase/GNAT superfamily N-acetyltransferase
MKIIDAHVHIGKLSQRVRETEPLPFNLYMDYESLISTMDKAQVTKAVVLPIPHKDFDSEKENDYLLEATRNTEGRLIPFCRIDSHLEDNLKKGFKGAKLHLKYDEFTIKDLKQEFQLLENYNVPILVHGAFKDKPSQIKEILKYAPNLSIILAHMGRKNIYTAETIVDNALALKDYDKVYFETSTIVNPNTGEGMDEIKKVCDIIGSDRLVFGTDYPYERDKYDYNALLHYFVKSTGNFTANDISNIMYHTISHLLDLNNDPHRLTIRKVQKKDFLLLSQFLEALSTTDKKFLALASKLPNIKSTIRDEHHCYVAEMDNHIVGFMRESGRPEGFSLLEEIVVDAAYRRKGIAMQMIAYYHRIFSKTLAKTNAKNNGMNALLLRNGYVAEKPNAPRIIKWKRKDER